MSDHRARLEAEQRIDPIARQRSDPLGACAELSRLGCSWEPARGGQGFDGATVESGGSPSFS
jgi:hypothetical protein